eukprot:6850098-Prymnesium_polylepis.1
MADRAPIQRLTQRTISFSSGFRLGGPASSALESVRQAQQAAEAAAAAARDAADAAAAQLKRKTKMVLDREKPVAAKLSLGWGTIKVELSLREIVLGAAINPKRTVYTPAQKRKILDETAGMQPAAAVKYLKTISGYEKINKKMFKDWRAKDGKKKQKAGVKPHNRVREG